MVNAFLFYTIFASYNFNPNLLKPNHKLMSKRIVLFFLIVFPLLLSAQVRQFETEKPTKEGQPLKARNDQYRIYSIERDTTFVDTSLTIQSEYKYNYLRKDTFGLLPFANEGQTYAVLNYGLNPPKALPQFGFKGKHFNYYKADDVRYYSVATPLSELYFKTVMEQGQNVDALIAINTSEQFNVSMSYKGLRSLGKYINQLSSTGNFKVTASYFTKNKRYISNFHYVGQDILNGENGGITTISDFEGEEAAFRNRARLQVYFTDAKSMLKGKRAFIDHSFRINKRQSENNLVLTHQFYYEYQYFEFNQATQTTTINDEPIKRFGASLFDGQINDQVRFNRMFNQVGLFFKNEKWGKFKVFAEDYWYKQYYGSEVTLNAVLIPSQIKQRINSLGGQYFFEKTKIKGSVMVNQAISKQTFSEITARASYAINNKNSIAVEYQNLSKVPDNNYLFHQSSYVSYNWFNSFNNEKINTLVVDAKTQWVNATFKTMLLQDHLYFSDDNSSPDTLAVSPKQYNKSIGYLSLKVSKELKWRKWALDNTVLYQNVTQEDAILNLPQLTTRNTLYFSDHYFKKALFLQTGIIFNYFTSHYTNDYNPLLAESFVQNERKIGGFPMLDFFVNARIRQARIFLKAEHFNSSFTGNKFYTAPNYPFRDFMVRFGLVWNFFQ